MKYLKFTHVDAITGISVAHAPARNGPTFPDVKGLQFVFARESEYPTPLPEFFGTCDEDAITRTEGVLAVMTRAEFEAAQQAEMEARSPVPLRVTKRQAQLALLYAGKLDAAESAIAAIPDPTQRRAAQIEWGAADYIERSHPLIAAIAAAIDLSEEEIDGFFIAAAAL